PGTVTSISRVPENTSESVLALQWKNPIGDFDLFNISAFCKSPNKDSNRSQNISAETNIATANLEPLDPGTTCNVSITVAIFNVDEDNKVLEGDTVQKKNIRTNETAPQGVIFDDKTAVDARSLYVQWKKPDNPNGIVRNYRIMIIDMFRHCSKENTSVEKESIPDSYTCTDVESLTYEPCTTDELIIPSTFGAEPLSANVSGLHPYRNYSVNIQAYTKCWGETKELIDQTEEAAPRLGPKLNVSEIGANSINVSWKHLDFEDRNGRITGYKIHYGYNDKKCSDTQDETYVWTDTADISPDLTSYIVDDLQPFWLYEFSMSASTSAGEGPNSTCSGGTCHARTSESIPGDIDSETVHFTKNETNSVALTWRKPCRPNGIITGYSYKISNLNTLEVWDVNITGNVTKHTITGLLPYRNYSVQLAGITKIGKGNFTVRLNVATKIAEPVKPNKPNPTAGSSSSLNVTWSPHPQSEYTGPTSYTVQATDQDNTSFKRSCETQGFNSTSCVITGLHPYWNYNVIVTARTEVGSSRASDTQNGTTLQDTPGPVSSVLLSAENDIQKERSINVTWEPPSKRNLNGVLTKYHIICTNINVSISFCFYVCNGSGYHSIL
ncbi:phosphatidylinositol phosphatase PTPRQ-like, partial [Mercenaria mercenaria]|uniref:phosphatidylinositol phosphatase PTPRQ-like n=1 Tax=Mercenaria mercenaria TaxID=6596 RepID=UPI00234EA3BF